jgi:tyrosyl-tRNA synthetase
MLSIDDVLTRGVADILPTKKGLADLLKSKKITLYQGFDPSAPSLHLGHLVGLMKLRAFQKLGHKVFFLVGDFTGMIGDPTDKLATRKKLTRDQVLENAKVWKAQVSKVLDFSGPNKASIMFNSEWSDKISFKDLIEITSNLTVQQMIERDMFQARIKDEKPIYLHEFLYPVAQGYDSVMMNVDLEIGGSDQIFNMLVGRTLMRAIKGKEKFVLSTKLLVDKDGNKVGKTTGNALFLDSTPDNFYGGIMSFPDEVIPLSFELLTELPIKGIEKAVKDNPLQEKKRLAFSIVEFLWGKESAEKAEDTFKNTFQKQVNPEDAPIIFLNENILPLLDLLFQTKKVSSRSEAKRLITQGAIEIAGKKITDASSDIAITKKGVIIKIGKKVFVKVVRG